VVIGDAGVGKTELIYKHILKKPKPYDLPTVGVEFGIAHWNLPGSGSENAVPLQVWDTSGQERYRAITSQHYFLADGVIVMYDVTSRQSFNSLESWLEAVRQKCSSTVQVMVLGNKNDKPDREVSPEEAERAFDGKGCMCHEVSMTKDGNVKVVLEDFFAKIDGGIGRFKGTVPLRYNKHQEGRCC
jgi:small GTP-binding protein